MTRRQFLRCMLVASVVIACGGSSCMDYRDYGVQYAPGYGYVVQVKESSPAGKRFYYFIFETEEEARAFRDRCHSTTCGDLFSEYAYVPEEDERYDDITRLLQRPPPIVNVGPAVEMPQPIPPTPQ